MIALVQSSPVQLVAVGTQPRTFVDPDSAVPVDAAETIVDFTGLVAPRAPVRELAEVEAEILVAKADARAASDRADELERLAGDWNLQVAVVELQRARALGAAEGARIDQSRALEAMWRLESERDGVLERRRQHADRRRELQEVLADG